MINALSSLPTAGEAATPTRPRDDAFARAGRWVQASIPSGYDGVDELKEHLQTLRLLDGSGRVAVPALASLDLLAPFDPASVIDRVRDAAAQNPYLARFVGAASERPFAAFAHPERPRVIPSALAYLVLLDRLTRALHDDWRLYAQVRAHFREQSVGRAARGLRAFDRVKFATVDQVVARDVRAFERGFVDPSMGSVLVPLNVLEAIVEDLRLGYVDNARAGLTLLVNRPRDAADPRTGIAPARFSADGKAVTFGLPLARKWADLYTTWNLAFSSHYERFPFPMSKLLAPAVLAYQAKPDEYLYFRRLALYLHLGFAAFGRADARRPFPDLDWSDRELSTLWGACNRESAREYEEELHRLDPTFARRLKTETGRLWDRLSRVAETRPAGG